MRGIFCTVDVRGTIDAIGGTEFLSELERLELQLFEADWAEARAIHGDDTRVEHLARIDKYRQLASSARSVSLKFSLRQIRCHFQEHLQKRAQ